MKILYQNMNDKMIDFLLFQNFQVLSTKTKKTDSTSAILFNTFIQTYRSKGNHFDPNDVRKLFYHFVFFTVNKAFLLKRIVNYLNGAIVNFKLKKNKTNQESQEKNENLHVYRRRILKDYVMPILSQLKVNYRESLVLTTPGEYQTCPFLFYERYSSKRTYLVKETDPSPVALHAGLFNFDQRRRLALLKEKIIGKLDKINEMYKDSVGDLLKNMDL